MDIMDSETTSTILTSSRRRMPNSLHNQEGVLREKLTSLRQSRGGYVATMTKVCSQVDDLLVDFANLMQVQNLQATLNDAFENYRDNISRAEGLLAGDIVELQESMVYTYTKLKRSGKAFTILRLNNIP